MQKPPQKTGAFCIEETVPATAGLPMKKAIKTVK